MSAGVVPQRCPETATHSGMSLEAIMMRKSFEHPVLLQIHIAPT